MAPDPLGRDFSADQLRVADITYVRTRTGLLHLAVVLDAWRGRMVGWSMAAHVRTELGPGCDEHGDLPATAAKAWCTTATKARGTRVDRVRSAVPGGWRATVDRLGGRCVRQRGVRDLLRDHAPQQASRLMAGAVGQSDGIAR